MYPGHDVPVVQLSVQPGLGTARHVALGQALAPLAADGVLIVGSGHTTHNLRDWIANPRRREPLAYAQAFADWLGARLAAHDTQALVDYRDRAPEAARAHPTEEHFLPLFVAWGAAGDAPRVERIVEGFEAGSLALDSYAFHQVH
jgi:4,5-DOPA dioxygenase extradiol